MTTPIKYRISSTATKPVSDTVKGAPLTSLEIDGNFRSIKDSIELIQSAYLPAGYSAPVDYVAGVILSSAAQTVAYQGEVYAPKAAELPFTTSGVFEVAKFVQIQSVASVDLAATDGASLVGYDTGTVQDALDGAKSLQDYAALRAYTGRATRIYITGPLVTKKPDGIHGVFQYDQTDTTSSDNGGTVLIDSNGRRWKRDFSGEVHVKWFGAKGDGIADDAEPFQRAVNYCKTLSVLNYPTLGGCVLRVTRGTYIISNTINMPGMYGFYIKGDGAGNTNIVFSGGASTLFAYSLYIRCGISDMTLSAGTVTNGITLVPAAKVGTCVNFNSTGGGVNFDFDRVVFQYWNVALRTRDTAANGDGHVHNHCSFYNNNILWDNTNTQAVIWAFNNCQTYNNGICFKNPGLGLTVIGGDWINPGDFLVANISNVASQSVFKGLRFENFQNIDPSSTPRLLVLSGTTGNLTFENCVATGGGSLAGKTSSTLSGIFNVVLKNCIFDGNWDVSVDASVNGISSKLVFEQCTGLPSIVQTVNSGQGNIPINIDYINCRTPGKSTAYMTKRFRGASYSQAASLTVETLSDGIKIESTINNSSVGKTIDVFLPSPYQLAFVGADIIFRPSLAASVTINVWDSSSKTTLLGAVNAAASVAWQVLSITPSTAAFLTSTTNAPYVELTSTGNAGNCNMSISLKLRQV